MPSSGSRLEIVSKALFVSISRQGCRGRLKTALIAFIGLSLFGSSCSEGRTTWSTELTSPDGSYRATARSKHWGGPGNNFSATTVSLGQSGQSPSVIMAFEHQYDTMNLKLEWITANHLEITYGDSGRPGDQVVVDFQAIKLHQIRITAKEIPSGSSKATSEYPPSSLYR